MTNSRKMQSKCDGNAKSESKSNFKQFKLSSGFRRQIYAAYQKRKRLPSTLLCNGVPVTHQRWVAFIFNAIVNSLVPSVSTI